MAEKESRDYLGGLHFEFGDMPQDEKLREMMLYIADRCADDADFGAVKMNKIMYFADFWSYARYGEPVSGSQYTRQKQGPVPKRLLPVRSELETSGCIAIEKRERGKYKQHRVVVTGKYNLSHLSGRDVGIIEDVIEVLMGRNAKSVSDLSHGVAWEGLPDNELIPYESIFLSDDPIYPEDVEMTRSIFPEDI